MRLSRVVSQKDTSTQAHKPADKQEPAARERSDHGAPQFPELRGFRKLDLPEFVERQKTINPKEGPNAETKTDLLLHSPPPPGVTAAFELKAAAALNELQRNNELAARVFAGRDVVTKVDLGKQLAIDDRIARADTPGLLPIKQNFSPRERSALEFAVEHWDALTTDTISRSSLELFSNTNIITFLENKKGENNGSLRTLLTDFKTANTLGDKTLDGIRTELSQEPKVRQTTETVVELKNYREKALEIFDRIDTNQDGFLTKDELSTAVQDKTFRGQEAQVLAGLYKYAENIEELSNDEIGDENSGITRDDLKQFDQEVSELSDDLRHSHQATEYLRKNFDQYDTDHSGFISQQELDQYIATNGDSLTAKDKVLIQYLRENQTRIAVSGDDEFGTENDGITRHDLEEFNTHAKDLERDTVIDADTMAYRTQSSQQAGICNSLYANPEDPLKNISPDAIRQGAIGDCYFLAALAAIAKQHPEIIRDMIRDNGNGTYTITFPGDKNNPITVSAPTETEMGLYNKGDKSGNWAVVMEKAFGQYRQLTDWLPNGGTPSEGGDGGGWSEHTLQLLTGHSPDKDILSLTRRATVQQKLTAAFADGTTMAVTASTSQRMISKLLGGADYTAAGFPKSHVYSITNFDPNGPGGGTITIRNPWGIGNGTAGQIEVSLDEFVNNFTDIVYSNG